MVRMIVMVELASHDGNSHWNVKQINIHANEMHKFKNTIIQKVEMNVKKAQERTNFTMTKNIAI